MLCRQTPSCRQRASTGSSQPAPRAAPTPHHMNPTAVLTDQQLWESKPQPAQRPAAGRLHRCQPDRGAHGGAAARGDWEPELPGAAVLGDGARREGEGRGHAEAVVLLGVQVCACALRNEQGQASPGDGGSDSVQAIRTPAHPCDRLAPQLPRPPVRRAPPPRCRAPVVAPTRPASIHTGGALLGASPAPVVALILWPHTHAFSVNQVPLILERRTMGSPTAGCKTQVVQAGGVMRA